MLDQISPYALLCASKPKQRTVYTLPYDLYSAVQHEKERDSSVSAMQATMQIQETPAQFSREKRTHYIADIHSRHMQAIQRSCASNYKSI